MQCHMGFLYSLGCTDRCHDVSGHCNRQIQHTDMDQRTCCSRISMSRGNQSPPGTRTACTYRTDFLCSPPNKSSRPCEIWGCRQHSRRRSGKSRGPDTPYHSMPGSVHIRCHFGIQLMEIFHDNLRNEESFTGDYLTFFADSVWVSDEAPTASANCTVPLDRTLCINAACEGRAGI